MTRKEALAAARTAANAAYDAACSAYDAEIDRINKEDPQ